MNLKKNDIIKITSIPESIAEMPQETIDIFNKCLGKKFRLADIEIDPSPQLLRIEVCWETTGSMTEQLDTIWIEPEFVEKISTR